jgi:hypothetical protein
MDAAIMADNVVFTRSRPRTFEATLKNTATIAKFIKYDSAKLVEHYVEDLHVFATKVQDMVVSGSINILRLLTKRDIEFNMNNVPLDNACRNVAILHLMFENGYNPIVPTKKLDYFAKNGMLEHLKLFYNTNQKRLPTAEGVAKAARAGHLEVVKWAVSRSKQLLPSVSIDLELISNGHLVMLQWLFEHDQGRKIHPMAINTAIVKRYLNILDWAYGVDPGILERSATHNRLFVSAAYVSGNIKGLEWLREKNINIRPNRMGLGLATYKGHLHVLKWINSIYSDVLPNLNDLNAAAGGGHLDLLKWVHNKKDTLIPDTRGATNAAKGGHILVLE